MKIFISWSGLRSQALAEALRDWLPLVLHYVDPWLSKSDIKSGDRWGIEVAKELQETNFGIICVTRENLNSPWILFEAGALAKSMEDGRVTPLLLDLDIKEISGPLAQFQARKADKSGIKQLVSDLNKSAPSATPKERLNQLFEPLYAALGDKIEAIPAPETGAEPTRPEGEILEELVASVRSVETRVRDAMDEDFGPRRRSRRRIHPGMLMELTHSISDDPHDPIQLLVFFSLFKDDAPWLYELALELYRAITSRNLRKAQGARDKLKRALDMVRRGPFLEMFGVNEKAAHMVLMDASEFMPALRELDFLEEEDERAPTEAPPRRSSRKPLTKLV
jgi:hypothetical protein